MKQIKIFSPGSDPILIDDENNEPVEKYSSDLAKILESNNISILHTTSSSVIIRPNIISVIVITGTEEKVKKKVEKKIETSSESEDLITLEE